MASVQQVHNASQLSHDEKAKVGKAIDEAKNVLENAKASQNPQVSIVAGAMHNNQEKGILNYDSHNYQGDFLAKPAKDIPGSGSGAFVHQEASPAHLGSKAVVIYGHYYLNNQAAGGGPLGWLLAWDKPQNGIVPPNNKVYVEAGSLERLRKLGWTEIEKRLDASKNISRYWDSDTGAAAVAKIEDYGTYAALVGATFEIKTELPPQAN